VPIPDSARKVLESDALGHLVTINRDGSPQASIVWVGVEGDDLVTAHLHWQQKLRNVSRDPRVLVSFEAPGANPIGMRHSLVVQGRAAIEEGGAPELLQELAYVYIGPGVTFPPLPDPPPGWRLRITVDKLGGIGPWSG
jgi:PPOX class probable F420-dependent enzyme